MLDHRHVCPPPSAPRYLCPTIHAERLHEDRVWRAVTAFLTALERSNGRGTVFVHPYWSQRAGSDVTGRVREIAERGHEVGQHTHYYAPREHDPKVTLATPENIRRRLDEDFAFLTKAGLQPRGFVSGGWMVDPEVYRWLAERDFAYDCSFRAYRLPYENPRAEPGNECTEPFWIEGTSLLEVPTTAWVTRAARDALLRRTVEIAVPPVHYRLLYLHDDDLLRRAERWALRGMVKFRRRNARAVPVRTVVDLLRDCLPQDRTSSVTAA